MLGLILVLGLGPLDDVRDEVHGDSSSSSSSSSSSDDDDTAGCCDDDDLGTTTGGGGGSTANLAWSGLYPMWPYDYGVDGYTVDVRAARSPHGPKAKPWALRARSEGSYLYNRLWRVGIGGGAAYRVFEVDTDWSWYADAREKDSLWLGDLNLVLVALRTPRVVMRVGGGGRFLVDSKPEVPRRSGNAFGWNITGGADLFVFDPVLLSLEADAGQLGNGWYWRARAALGVMLGPAEVFAGYDHTQLGKVRLGGPVVGLRLWI